MSERSVEFYFDVGSPAAYLAWTQLPALCHDAGAELVLRPVLLGGVFQATGNQSPVTVAAKGRYMWDDLSRYAARYRVPFSNNPHFPINTLALMRVAVGLQLREPGRLPAFLDTVFGAIWAEARHMGDPEVVASVLASAGFDAQTLLALAQDAEVKDRLKTLTAEAVARGIFGAPTMFVGPRMFWGQDRLDFVKEALQ
jgi:2-hydroxychromene-2-carboxylate isomerase